MILALSVGESVAWAVGRSSAAAPVTGTWALPGTDRVGAQAHAFHDALSDAITLHAPRLVAFQAALPAVREPDCALRQFGLFYIASLVLDVREVRMVRPTVDDVRRVVLGRANGLRSADVLAWCRGRAWDVRSPECADTAALWAWAVATHGDAR